MHMQRSAPIPDASDASTEVTGHPRVPISTVWCPHVDLNFSLMRLSPPQRIISNTDLHQPTTASATG